MTQDRSNRAGSKTPKAYILMRIYKGNMPEEEYYSRLNDAIESIKRQKYPNKVLLLYFDGEDKITEGKIKEWTEGSVGVIFPTPPQSIKGSAYGTLWLRRRFVELAENEPKSVAIILDQDDRLHGRKAIDKIMRRFVDEKPTVCISNFREWKDGQMQPRQKDQRRVITNIRIQQSWVPRCLRDMGRWIKKQAEKWQWVRRIENSAWLNKCIECTHWPYGADRLYMADSLAWTKAYNQKAMALYCKSLDSLFEDSALQRFNENERQSADAFFIEHKAYEDFMDQIMLMCKNVRVTATYAVTHEYVRHETSITGSKSVAAFKADRLAYLSLIAAWHEKELRDSKKDGDNNGKNYTKLQLRKNSEEMLLAYLAYKINRINDILKANAKRYAAGDDSYEEFAILPDAEPFIEMACRQLREKTPESWKTLRGVMKSNNLAISIYHARDLRESHGLYRRYRVLWYWRKWLESKRATGWFTEWAKTGLERYLTKRQRKLIETAGRRATKRPDTPAAIIPPKKNRSILTFLIIASPIIILILGICVMSYIQYREIATNTVNVREYLTFLKESWISIISILTGILSAILGIFYSRRDKRAQERKKREVYNNEFADFIRHLQAGARVLLELVYELKKSPDNHRPAAIHLVNLQVPANSILLSNDPILTIQNDRLGDMAELKVKIRNINNSARTLEHYATSADYNKDDMVKLLDWEISRYFGFLATFSFYQKHNRFLEPEEFESYVELPSVFNKFVLLYMDRRRNPGEPERDIKAEVRKYLEMSKRDRRIHRTVNLVH